MNLLISIGVRILEAMFVLGCIGAVLVLLMSAVEDAETLLEKDEPSSL